MRRMIFLGGRDFVANQVPRCVACVKPGRVEISKRFRFFLGPGNWKNGITVYLYLAKSFERKCV